MDNLSPAQPAIGHISDAEVITRVIAGEKDLYAILVKRYNQRLYRVAMSILNDDAEAEDVMQVSYIRAYENLAKFESRSAFSTWLTRILVNECLLRLKKRKKSLTMLDHIIEDEGHSPVAKEQTPLANMMNLELRNILENAIRGLPEKYRTVFVMREIEDMNIAETRECLGISEGNVKVRLNRAKALLKERISSLYPKEDLLHFHLTRCDRVTNAVMLEINKISN